MMPAERQAILAERQAGEEADRQALDAQIQAEQAERAEKKTREAAERDIWNGPLDQNRADWTMESMATGRRTGPHSR
jgi:hypothetical protein